jgi:RNA polymerase sigma factor (TIGR02999 family)
MSDDRDADQDPESLDHLFSVTYEELRRLAASVRRSDPSATLTPTALVNEAYLKLARSLRVLPVSRLHFKRIAARAMRQVLVEAARRRHAQRRGGGDVLVTFDEGREGKAARSDDLLALDAALDDLHHVDPQLAAVVQYRFFGGFDIAETAEALGVSESTIGRDWRLAKAWLAQRLRHAS